MKINEEIKLIKVETAEQMFKGLTQKKSFEIHFPKQLTLKAKKILALSKMVFPHKIARLILVEQLYRAKCIINRHPYHKT